jgi:hypothetical protein
VLEFVYCYGVDFVAESRRFYCPLSVFFVLGLDAPDRLIACLHQDK